MLCGPGEDPILQLRLHVLQAVGADIVHLGQVSPFVLHGNLNGACGVVRAVHVLAVGRGGHRVGQGSAAGASLLLDGQRYLRAIGVLGDGVPRRLVQGDGAHVGSDLDVRDIAVLHGLQRGILDGDSGLVHILSGLTTLAGGHIDLQLAVLDVHAVISILSTRELAADLGADRAVAVALGLGHHSLGSLDCPEAGGLILHRGIAGGAVVLHIAGEDTAGDGNTGSIPVLHSVHCIDSRIRDKCTTRDRNFRSLSHAGIIGRTVKDQSGARNDIAGISNHTSDVSSCLKLAAGDGDSSCACYNTSSASDIEGTTGNFDLILPGGIDPTGNIATAFNAAIEGATLDVDHVGVTSPARSVTCNNRIIRGTESTALNVNRCTNRFTGKYCTLHRFKSTRLNCGSGSTANSNRPRILGDNFSASQRI
ncbi:Uncharacterised protein [uncultured Flavonifractor sp.]|nr:Uncharacterised protein [uncultured Flavonifractor sp.]